MPRLVLITKSYCKLPAGACLSLVAAVVVICQLALTGLPLAARALHYQNDPLAGTPAVGSRPPPPPPSLASSEPDGEPPGAGGQGGLVSSVVSAIRPNEDPEDIREIVKKARADQLQTEIVSNRTRVMVSCDSGEMLVRINFTEPFRGVGYADFDRSSPCRLDGKGDKYYEMRLPLRGCGTKQLAPRLFRNDIVLRYHRSLELEEDEARTIVCRYPPPTAAEPPPAPGPPARLIDAPIEPARLTQYEPFVLIAGLLFFALLLAGVGTTSYVTRQQKITEINTPLPITSQTEYDTYLDNQSVKTVEDLTTTQKIIALPKYSTHTVDDVFITKLHEVDTHENLVHHRRHLPRAHLEHQNYEDTYITNEDELICEETLRRARLEAQRPAPQLGCEQYDDAYLTNQDERVESEQLTQHRLRQEEPKLEVRTIEDTFITNVDEVVKQEDTTYHKSHSLAREPHHGDYRRDQHQQHFGGELEHQFEHRSQASHSQPRAVEHFEEFETRLENLRR